MAERLAPSGLIRLEDSARLARFLDQLLPLSDARLEPYAQSSFEKMAALTQAVTDLTLAISKQAIPEKLAAHTAPTTVWRKARTLLKGEQQVPLAHIQHVIRGFQDHCSPLATQHAERARRLQLAYLALKGVQKVLGPPPVGASLEAVLYQKDVTFTTMLQQAEVARLQLVNLQAMLADWRTQTANLILQVLPAQGLASAIRQTR